MLFDLFLREFHRLRLALLVAPDLLFILFRCDADDGFERLHNLRIVHLFGREGDRCELQPLARFHDDLRARLVFLALVRREIVNFSAVLEFYADNLHRPSKMPASNASMPACAFALNFKSRSKSPMRSCALTSAATV